MTFCFCGAAPLVVFARPRKSSFCTPKKRLATLRLRQASLRYWKTSRFFINF